MKKRETDKIYVDVRRWVQDSMDLFLGNYEVEASAPSQLRQDRNWKFYAVCSCIQSQSH